MIEWAKYTAANKEQRVSLTFPRAFTKCFEVFRTNIDGDSPTGVNGAYRFFQISPNTTAGDSAANTHVYFWETANKRIGYVNILAIGYY